jgi:sigma-B regulation protein RsbU (phosphoserine phosphatase)
MTDADNASKIERLEQEAARLKAAVSELEILNDISTAINSTLSLEEIIELIVQKSIKHLHVEQGTVTLLEENEEDTPFRTIMRKTDMSREFLPYHLDTQLTGWMLMNRKPLKINDLRNDDHFRTVHTLENPIQSLLSVPLLLKGRILGSLNVFNKLEDGGFTEADERLLTIIATQSAQVIENARLYKEEQSLMHMREEMRMAYNIQMDLLPKHAPVISGYDIAGRSIPAKTVGGDYFDFIVIDEDHLAFCLGDVSGKGMPAALLMSNLQATLRGQIRENRTVAESIARSNSLLYQSTDSSKFATFFFGVIDNSNHTLTYCNAGHNFPFFIGTDSGIRRLETGGLILGALAESTYEDETLSFDPGKILVVFSDGISEALNADEEEFGEEAIVRIVIDNRGDAAEQLVGRILAAVRRHSGGQPQTDDMTIVVIKRTR